MYLISGHDHCLRASLYNVNTPLLHSRGTGLLGPSTGYLTEVLHGFLSLCRTRLVLYFQIGHGYLFIFFISYHSSPRSHFIRYYTNSAAERASLNNLTRNQLSSPSLPVGHTYLYSDQIQTSVLSYIMQHLKIN